jgi:hypothetical protein
MTMSEPIDMSSWKKEPIVTISRPFGGSYHVNLEYDCWESHVGIYMFYWMAVRKGRKALKKKLEEYYREKPGKIVITKFDLEEWGS